MVCHTKGGHIGEMVRKKIRFAYELKKKWLSFIPTSLVFQAIKIFQKL